MISGPFIPLGPTYLVGNAVVQCVSVGNCTAYRIRNLLAAVAYFTFAPAPPATAPVAPVAPVAGVPSANTIGMLPNSVETFELPPNVQMISNALATFEVTPGEGM